MLNEKVEQKLNEQIQKEFFSSYLYLSMEAYFKSVDLDGFANWYHIQAQEERDHAMKIYNYIDYVGGRIRLLPIQAPKGEYKSVREVLEDTLAHERMVTQSIYDIVDVAREHKDHKTDYFMQWYVKEQVEEENNSESNIKKLKISGEEGSGLFILDAEMGKRVYVPTPTGFDDGE